MPQTHPHSSRRTEPRAGSRVIDLSSPAFADGSRIPRRFTADGEDVSPALTWGKGPEGTECFALVCEDPDAPRGTFVHWVLWGIPPDRTDLPEAIEKAPIALGMSQGENDFGNVGWNGPSPPPGKPHRYVFRLYALDEKPSLSPGASRDDLDRAMQGHVLAEGMLIGMYGR